MKLLVMAVYDKAVAAYMPPFFVRSKGEGIRMFTEGCNDTKSAFHRFPVDYALCCIGSYDDVSGTLVGVDSGPEVVLQATEAIISVVGGTEMDHG